TMAIRDTYAQGPALWRDTILLFTEDYGRLVAVDCSCPQQMSVLFSLGGVVNKSSIDSCATHPGVFVDGYHAIWLLTWGYAIGRSGTIFVADLEARTLLHRIDLTDMTSNYHLSGCAVSGATAYISWANQHASECFAINLQSPSHPPENTPLESKA